MSKVEKAKYTAEAQAGFNHRTAMEEAARCLLCHDAPCSEGCPAGTTRDGKPRSARQAGVGPAPAPRVRISALPTRAEPARVGAAADAIGVADGAPAAALERPTLDDLIPWLEGRLS